MTRAAWRGVGVLLACAGVLLGLLGAGRIAPAAQAGSLAGAPAGSPPAYVSRPQVPLFATGIALLLASVALLRRTRVVEVEAEEGGGTEALLRRLRRAVLALREGRAAPAVGTSRSSSSSGSLPVMLEALVEAEAPTEEAPYLLWLKLQLDPLLEDLLPRLFAGRDAFRRRHGVVAYGALFSGLARAERLLGRAWSSAVDGYADEARQALADAAAQVERLEGPRSDPRPDPRSGES